MPCYPITDSSGKRRIGFVCTSSALDAFHLGHGVWMEWHNYHGPFFYSDRALTKPIHDWSASPRIVKAFEAWQAKNPHITQPKG